MFHCLDFFFSWKSRTGCGTDLSAICWRPAASQPCRGPNPGDADGNVSTKCSEAMSRKNKRIKKELKLTPSDALTLSGSFACASWWKCHHHSHLPQCSSRSGLLQRLPRTNSWRDQSLGEQKARAASQISQCQPGLEKKSWCPKRSSHWDNAPGQQSLGFKQPEVLSGLNSLWQPLAFP